MSKICRTFASKGILRQTVEQKIKVNFGLPEAGYRYLDVFAAQQQIGSARCNPRHGCQSTDDATIPICALLRHACLLKLTRI
jgi:hypothetical protein